MTNSTLLQRVRRGLAGHNFEPRPECTECGAIVTGTVYMDPTGDPLCVICFKEADLIVCVDCEETWDRDDCRHTTSGEVCKNTSGEVICEDCFDIADLVVCGDCKEVKARDDCRENPDGVLWCGDCMDNSCSTCEHCDEERWSNDIEGVVTRDGRWYCAVTEYWCESCRGQDSFTCSDCGGAHGDDQRTDLSSGSSICQSCFDDGYFCCEGCDEVFHCDDMARSDVSYFCRNCRRDGENFGPSGFRNRSGCVTEIGSARCFGVELETDECDGYEELDGSLAWGAKDDPTVSGKEFYSDILSGDEGLTAVEEWAELASQNGWEAHSSSGYHLHIDARQESDDQLYGIAYAYRATQEVWRSFVKSHRRNNSYCRGCEWTCADVVAAHGDTLFRNWARHGNRYFWCNTTAYNIHSTVEIRLHHGTCNETEVINWVKAHTRFVDWASTLGLEGVREKLDGLGDGALFNLIADEAWRDDKLRDYYTKKARQYA